MRIFLATIVAAMLLNSNSAYSAEPISIPCLDDGGGLVNAKPEDVCKALLPKCSELKTNLVNQLKDMISWKIYGYYYLGKDIKLELGSMTGSGASAEPEGESLPYPICSVVGHKISGSEPGEINQQTAGKNLSCGAYPEIKNGNAWHYKAEMHYEGAAGNKWYSYVLGAYPWELRRNAFEVIKDLKSDLSNINDVIHTDSMAQDVKNTLEIIKTSTKALSAEAKTTCNQAPEHNIVTSCMSGALSVTDPVQKLCTLAKAQQALNAVATPNMLVYEVMDRTKKMHAAIFGNIFVGDSNPKFKAMMRYCADSTDELNILATFLIWPIGSFIKNLIFARKAYACNASCLTNGGRWRTWANWTSSENSDGPWNRSCNKSIHFSMSNGGPAYWGGEKTNNVGFAGLVESIIRRDICPQDGHHKNGANVCDAVDIKDKPPGK